MRLLYLLIACSLSLYAGTVDSKIEPILSNESILETLEIEIPGYPNAFNPSLISYKEGYLLSFRYRTRFPEALKNDWRANVSFIGVAKLDEQFKVCEEPVQLLDIASHSSQFSLTVEDARLICVNNRIFIFFNDLFFSEDTGCTAMYFGELVEKRGRFVFKGASKLLRYTRAIGIEKNWSPFVLGDQLYLIYSDQPRVILAVDLHTGECQEVSRGGPEWKWDFGQMRGGTPGVLIGDQFLTFFHSSFSGDNPKRRTYVMGAYTFEKEFPFSIRSMNPYPLGEVTYYSENNRTQVVFPGGIVVEKERILVAWGKGDKQIFLTIFDSNKLLSSMKP